MVIQRSSSAQTTRLIGDLIGTDPVRREAAVARLAIVGERAVDRLLAALNDATPDASVFILRTLESIGSSRALPAALTRLNSTSDAVTIAAVGAVRPHLRATDDDIAAQSLEGLTTLALATGRSDPPRLAALEALGDMGPETVQPIRDGLRDDPSARVRRMAGGTSAAQPAPLDASARLHAARLEAATRLEAAAHGTLPEDAETMRALLAAAGSTIALSGLHELVLALRARERAELEAEGAASAPTRGADADSVVLGWMTARAAVHQALAERHSRLAVFDLRDTFEQASVRLPVGFLAAITEVGDASCLPALAAAWKQVDDRWMRDHLAAAFQAIMTREGLTRRHAAVRRALERAPDIKPLLK